MDNDLVSDMLAWQFLGNTVQAYLIALAVFVGVIILIRIFKVVIVRRLHHLAKRTATDIDDFLIGLLRHVGPIVYISIAFYVATRPLVLTEGLQQILYTFFVIIVTIKVIQLIQEVMIFFLNKWASVTEREDPTSAVVVRNMTKVLRVVLWIVGTIFIFDNMGVNVTSVVAGLGIGGVAVALAAQAVLGDAFSSFAIFLDKPFKVGDFIIVGDLLGTVEHVGFKTTRIRSLGGEQLIFSNSDLTSSRVRNYKRMETRRIVFKIGVTYQTTTEKVKAIPKMIERIIRDHELTKFDRSHFQSYGDFALIFETVYSVLSPDYNQYMNVQHHINICIKEEFEKAGIEFAYPTQQLFVTNVAPPV
jgi:small-conductance mechanosensitive channel